MQPENAGMPPIGMQVLELTGRVSENEKNLGLVVTQIQKAADQIQQITTSLAVVANTQENANQRIADLYSQIAIIRDLNINMAALNERMKNAESDLKDIKDTEKRMTEQADTQKFWIIMTGIGWSITVILAIVMNFVHR